MNCIKKLATLILHVTPHLVTNLQYVVTNKLSYWLIHRVPGAARGTFEFQNKQSDTIQVPAEDVWGEYVAECRLVRLESGTRPCLGEVNDKHSSQ
jgi:hypothetical protein